MAERNEAAGKPPPRRLLELEDLDLWIENQEAWRAFWDLHPTRQIGMGAGGIPLSEIEAYLRLTGQPGNLALVEKIRAVDDCWLEAQARKMKREKETRALGGKPGPETRIG